MHTKTERWTEERQGRTCVGCSGYDDPVYEYYTYTEACSRKIIVFDSEREKKEFFTLVNSYKPIFSEVFQDAHKEVEDKIRTVLSDAQKTKHRYERFLRHKYSKMNRFQKIGSGFISEKLHRGKLNPSEERLRRTLEEELYVKFEDIRFIDDFPTDFSMFIDDIEAKEYRAFMSFTAQVRLRERKGRREV